ncbi:immunoglobulin superfamily member 1-like isoform X2 [Paramormyrops kingsleyae]|uniref:immunoglobulin superfamily member 1-like isoform X2 n=1 Tax=Paramormyrops kingsleyae TaxID=1676925 RepID=UPI003B975C0C
MSVVLLLAYTLANMMPTHAIDDIHPAKVFMKEISTVGGEVEVICSTYGFRKDPSESVYIYLCKNGIGVRRQLHNNFCENKIILKNVTKHDTGNYSCVFSKSMYKPSEVQRKGDNSVFFRVIDDFIPANIAVRDDSVREGDDVVLRCTLQDVQMLYSSTSFAYLSKDGVPEQLQTWDTEKNEAKFTIKSITKENNGNYSCVLFKSGLLTSTSMKLYGNNTVLLSARATFSDDFIPANIAVRDDSVREGDDVVLRCTLQDVQMLYSSTSFAYLSKDGVPVQLQTWNTEKNEAKFTIKSITKENNGNYSCVLFKSGLLTSMAVKLYGNNTVLLSARATFSESILAVGQVGIILLLILVIMVGVWRYRVTKKGKSKGGPEREQEEDNRNSTEIHHSVPDPEDDTFQETGSHTYESAEFSDEDETSFCDENWVYHEVEVSDYMTIGWNLSLHGVSVSSSNRENIFS